LLVQRGETLTEGFELLPNSISGAFPADINTAATPTLFAIKRTDFGLREYFIGTPFVDDICVVIQSQGEDFPDDYVQIKNAANKGKILYAFFTISQLAAFKRYLPISSSTLQGLQKGTSCV